MILPCLIAWLASRITRHQTHVIRYLREENRILKAKRKGGRIPLTDTERRRLAVLAPPIDRKDLKEYLDHCHTRHPPAVVSSLRRPRARPDTPEQTPRTPTCG